MQNIKTNLKELSQALEGQLFTDKMLRTIYATDASAYQEMPLAVAIPKTENDLKKLIVFAKKNMTSLIPRAAGTSLAGQVVGNGIVVDISRHFTKILEINAKEKWVKVQPGVVRDELNYFLKKHGLFFGPETSTANRAMIGGMVGNNSCGTNSVVYGSTREHLLSVKAILSDGTTTEFSTLTNEDFKKKCNGEGTSGHLESGIYKSSNAMLSDIENQKEIKTHYPKTSIPRRNTGYALDLLLEGQPFSDNDIPFNFCKLIAGSEGTLAFTTEIKLGLVPLPSKNKTLLCLHCDSIDESLRANLIALQYSPTACELMDHYVLECTKENIEQRENRFFVKGDPKAILAIELTGASMEEVEKKTEALIEELEANKMGYHFPVVKGEDIAKVWNLRKAGLGLLANIPGDAKAVPVIEDTAVDVQDLPAYIRDFNKILDKHGLYSVHYAHAGSGELHLRPIIDLKTERGNELFRIIAKEIAKLVKKYEGSLSGEHGDGRLRGEFIEFMVGAKNYNLLKEVKKAWDPDGIFNPNKIVDTPPMNTQLRFAPGQKTTDFDTAFNFEDTHGILRATEKCNGSADCRKTEITGGTMCPSYMATRNEKDTTRARANILRDALTNSDAAFDNQEILEVMDLCLSCKGCKSECPSNVDIAKLKAESLHQYYKVHGVPFRTKMIGNFNRSYQLGAIVPGIFNFFASNKLTSNLIKGTMGFAKERSLPLLYKTTLRKWHAKNKRNNFGIAETVEQKGKVYLFCDEFTNLTDTEVGITTIKLLTRLGYEVMVPKHLESGRTYISKGLLKEAKKIAIENVMLLKDLVSDNTPLLGIEPSAILTLRDEYLTLVPKELEDDAKRLAKNTLTVEEFIAAEINQKRIDKSLFTEEKQIIKLHGHCHQKSLSSLVPTKKMLSLPENYEVHIIRSGCCGMAGSFGFEKKHYELSMQVGELVLFPAVRKQPKEVIIAAPGTSCRHQIKDGTGKAAKHPIDILWNSIKK